MVIIISQVYYGEIYIMKQISIKHLSNLHTDALRALDFYLDELKIFQERLEEISGANTGLTVSIEIEHFQNLFIIHQEQIQELRHQMNENLRSIALETSASSGFLDSPLLDENIRLNEQFLQEEKIFKDMKTTFYTFASKWM